MPYPLRAADSLLHFHDGIHLFSLYGYMTSSRIRPRLMMPRMDTQMRLARCVSPAVNSQPPVPQCWFRLPQQTSFITFQKSIRHMPDAMVLNCGLPPQPLRATSLQRQGACKPSGAPSCSLWIGEARPPNPLPKRGIFWSPSFLPVFPLCSQLCRRDQ